MSFPLEGDDPRIYSRQTIISALPRGQILQECYGTRVVRIMRTAVVKYGTVPQLCEASNMKIVHEQSLVRLPELYDYWTSVEAKEEFGNVEGRINYIIMSFIEGNILDDIWHTLSQQLRQSVLEQLQDIINQLRKIRLQSPGPVGGGVSQGFLFTYYGAGPFHSQQDLENWFSGRQKVCEQFGMVFQSRPNFDGRCKPLVMCHMDLHKHNMILDKEDRLWLIDWAFAGGYPPWFENATLARIKDETEFSQALNVAISNPDYEEEIDQLDSIGFALTTGALCQRDLERERDAVESILAVT